MHKIKMVLFFVLGIKFIFAQPQAVFDHIQQQSMNNTLAMAGNSNRATYHFDGFLKNGENIKFTSAIYSDSDGYYSGGKAYVRLDDDKFFESSKEAAQIKYVGDFDSLFVIILGVHYDSTRYLAISHKGQWIFQKINGRISLFTSEPGTENYSFMKLPDQDLVVYNDTLLLKTLRANPESKKLLDARTMGITSSILLVISGIVVTFIGISNSENTESRDANGMISRESSTSPLIGIGIGTMLASWIPYLFVKNNTYEAIEAFNLGKP